MTPKPRLLALLLLAGAVLAANTVAGAEEWTTGTPTQGPKAIQETVAQIMQRQSVSAPRSFDPEDREKELEQPDRRNLPQAPGALPGVTFPPLPPGASPVGDVSGMSPQVVGTNFTAATLSGTNPTLSFPPDCMGAVGPSQYVVFVNGRLVTFNKTTGIADGVINADPDVFFNSVRNGSFTSDPRIRYDRLTGRWILAIINVSTPNRILVAVSDAASASAITVGTVWSFYFIDIATTPPAISNTCLADYPTMGIDANAIYIGTNNFCGSPSQTFNSTDGYVIRKSSVLSGGPIVVTVFRGLVPTAASAGPYTPQGVDNYDPAATEGYFIGVDNAAFSLLQLRRVSNPGGTPSLSSNVSLSVSTTQFPLNVPHFGNTGGTNGLLSSLDDRLFAAHIRNGHLWTAHNVGVNNTGASTGTLTRNGSRWYEINVPPTTGALSLVQSGTVFTSTANNLTTERHYWVPSIMVSGQGHAALGMSAAGTNERANAATVGRLSGDVAGTMQTPELFTASASAYNPPSDPGGAGIGRRWGDYTYTSLDPLDDMTMWTVQEFCNATNSYGVRVAKLIPPGPATPSALADVNAGQNPVNLTLTGTSIAGTGFYDPGANLPGVPAFNHLTAAITNGGATGTPPTVVSATYVSPTSVSLVLNASSATANLPGEFYTLTVTNPDGQQSSAAIVHVVGGATPPVATVTASPSQNEGNSGTSVANFTVTLNSAATSTVTINYHTVDGTATTADNDYVGVSSSAIINVGGTFVNIPVTINGDTKFEGNETFTLQLDSATNATIGSPNSGTGTIQNDDTAPTMSVSNVSLQEGNTGTTPFSFNVTLSAPSGLQAQATFTTSDGTATVAGNDYGAVSTTVTFPPGSTSQQAVVQVTGDTFSEPDETFNVALSALSNASAGTLNATGTIQNDDAFPTVSVNNVQHPEGNSGTTTFTFTATLSAASNVARTIHYQTVDGTATVANGDYQVTSGDLVIPAFSTTGTIDVLASGDVCGESDEAFFLQLSDPTVAQQAFGTGPVGTGTIQNDDDATAPAAAVTVPNGGEVLQIGTQTSLTWTASDNVAITNVDLALSRDGGATYPETLAVGVPNSGSFDWTPTAPSTTTARLLVIAHDANCNVTSDASDADFQISASTGVTSLGGAVTRFAISGVRPNPTPGRTEVDFDVPADSRVRLTVVDLQGRLVAQLAHRDFAPGRYRATWDGQTGRGRAPVGVYFVRLEAGGGSLTKRLVLAR